MKTMWCPGKDDALAACLDAVETPDSAYRGRGARAESSEIAEIISAIKLCKSMKKVAESWGLGIPGKDAPHFLKAFCIEIDSQADQAERRMALLAWARQNLPVGDAVRGHEVFMRCS